MRMLNRVLLVIVAVLLFSGTGCAAGKKGSGIEGKVVDGSGKPLAGIKVVATQKKPLKGYERFEVKTKADGTFIFKGLFPASDYIITPTSDEWKTTAKVEVQSGPEGQTAMLDKPFMIRFTQNKAGVVVDSETGLQWAPSNGQPMNHYQAEGYVRSLDLDGGGWRMPSIMELKQISPAHFLLNAAWENWVWSGELCNNGARGFLFYASYEGCYSRDDSANYYRALAVRSPK